jgi:two-component system chemotaxis response regulator CheB
VQDPNQALFSSMPQSAIQNVKVDHIVSITEMPAVLVELVHEHDNQSRGARSMRRARNSKKVHDVAESGDDALKEHSLTGPPSKLTCPECGGALWELNDGKLLHFRCHIGHAYTEQGLTAAQSDRLEEAMWTALRVLSESAELHRKLADRASSSGLDGLHQMHAKRVAEVQQRAQLIRGVLALDGERADSDMQQPQPTTSTGTRSKNGSNGSKRRKKGEIEEATEVLHPPPATLEYSGPRSGNGRRRTRRR